MKTGCLNATIVLVLLFGTSCTAVQQTQPTTEPTEVPPTSTQEPTLTSTPPPTETPTPEPTVTSTPFPTREPTRPPKEIPTLSPEADSYEEWISLFEYDPDESLDLEEEIIKTEDNVTISDIRYASPIKGSVKAYLVVPNREGPFAGMIFFHWYEPGAATNNRSEFLEEAITLADQGVVSLLIQGFLPWSRSPNTVDFEKDRNMVVEQVLDLRRGIDVLLSRQDIDPQRIGFVGHDFGAMYGSILSGIDSRVKAYVLMAGTGNFSNWFLKYWTSETKRDNDAYRAGMLPVDPINYLSHAAPATLFFQFAKNDDYVSPSDGQEQFGIASEPKSIQWYSTDHQLNETAQRQRINWLKNELGIQGEY
jgi:predicted esterase